MTDTSRQFIIKTLILTIIVFAIASTLFSTVLKTWYFTFYPFQLLLIATVTTIGHLWIVRATAQNARKFTTAYMASVTLKLMTYLIFMLVYLLIDRSHVIAFVLTFITFYTIFTVFEVIQVLKLIKKQS
ncbi:MAG: hypothetical protein NTY07_12950 [Bacteroidia bacterium]|nr:hypothetical protein [Bacteroidia bacterium]